MPTTREPRGRSREAGAIAAPSLVVFTDLDGTLLRHEDYDWSPAREAIEELKRRRIPLVIASSKTRAEIEVWRTRLGNQDAFISENGGALYVPPESTVRPPPLASMNRGYFFVRFGATYSRLRRGLETLSHQIGVELRGFGDMSASEIGRRTGLSGEDLALAADREHDEPFVPARPLRVEEEKRLIELADTLGLRVTRGGRFYHLMGPGSKGPAAQLLMTGYAGGADPIPSLGLGDGPNDLELLRVVDRPVVVARPDGTHAPELCEGVPHARFTKGIGPEGFNEAVLEYLARPW